MTRKRKRRGAPPGNQNGRRHGFYSKTPWVPQENDALPGDATVDELDRAIAIMRMKVRSILRSDPANERLVAYCLSSLNRLLRTRCLVSGRRMLASRQAVEDLGRSLAITRNSIQAQTP